VRDRVPRSRSLATRLATWYAASAFGLLLAATGFLYWTLARSMEREQAEFLMRYRYVLSPAVSPGRFGAAQLRAALESGLQRMLTAEGGLLRETLPRDPTGELLAIVGRWAQDGPAKREGLWFSPDGRRALLLAETVAGGAEIARQSDAIRTIREAFSAETTDKAARLIVSGPGAFAVASRETIDREAWLLSLAAGTLVLLVLFRVYRAPRIVGLCMLPALSGLAIGTAVVSAGFDSLHAITLGFGATLIGEAVDYPSYACAQAAPGESLAATVARIWPTLRLAVLTTVFGALILVLSSFTGLAQLGTLSMCGVLAAGLVTRWVLPALAGPRPLTATGFVLPGQVEGIFDRLRALRPVALLLAALAAAFILLRGERLWEDDLGSLNPVPKALRETDRQLRAELGAPDVRHLLVVTGPDLDSVLARNEEIVPWLDALERERVIAGYDVVSRYLPSCAAQERRLAAVPPEGELRAALAAALAGLPFRPEAFEPFVREAEQSRKQGLLRLEDLQGTLLGAKLQSLLVRHGEGWVSFVALRGVAEPSRLASAARQLGRPYVLALDLKAESDALVAGYRAEALRLAGIGLAAIVLVLAWGLRSAAAVAKVLGPVLASLLLSVCALQLLGERMTIFHVIALLLVLGIGLNYALFFNQPAPARDAYRRTLLALLVCSLTTVLAFGSLAWSSTAVLHAIGLTVSIGAVTALLVAAALAPARSP